MSEEIRAYLAEALRDDKDSKLVRYGRLASFAYIASVFVYVTVQRDAVLDMQPNEFADLLAGTFAPLAFLWLVLGFFQQGTELRNSTRALVIQAEELRASVEQQQQLVEVTRLQLENETTRANAAEAETVRLAQPIFQLENTGSSQGVIPNTRLHSFALRNSGRACTNVRLDIDATDSLTRFPKLDSGAYVSFSVARDIDDREPASVTIRYIDARNVEGVVTVTE